MTMPVDSYTPGCLAGPSLTATPPKTQKGRSAVPFVTYLVVGAGVPNAQTVFIAAGLAVGVALVITVSAVAAGTSNAQVGVLHGLYGIGTDMTVTRPWTPSDTEPGHEYNVGGQIRHFEYLDDANQDLFSSSAATSIAGLPDVRAAVGVLALDEENATTGARRMTAWSSTTGRCGSSRRRRTSSVRSTVGLRIEVDGKSVVIAGNKVPCDGRARLPEFHQRRTQPFRPGRGLERP